MKLQMRESPLGPCKRKERCQQKRKRLAARKGRFSLWRTIGFVELRASRPARASWPGGDARLSTSRRLLRLGDRSEETKEAFHPCNFQRLVDPLIHPHQPQAASIFLSSDIGSDQRPNSR